MEMTQFNTRIPVELKLEGDEVLSRFGISASDAVRALWSYMASHQAPPAFVTDPDPSIDETIAEKLALVRSGAGLAGACCKELGIDPESVRRPFAGTLSDELYDGLLDEYEALDA